LDTQTQLGILNDILDIGSGISKSPVASISLPIYKVYSHKGVDAAINEYYRIKKHEPEKYQHGIGELTWAINEIINEGMYEDALKLLDIEYDEYPRCHICLTYAQVYMEIGNMAKCKEYYNRWLQYLPDQKSEKIEDYLKHSTDQ